MAAVTAADLVSILQGAGPCTEFAPANAAFDKLPKRTVETLLKAENKAALQWELTYHVLAGKFSTEDIVEVIKNEKEKS